MSDINGNVVSTQPLVYQPGTTVELLYPGTSRQLQTGQSTTCPAGSSPTTDFWIRDPSDEFLRDGINLTYTVNPTATAFVTYPPESSACANPDGPFPPGPTTTAPPLAYCPDPMIEFAIIVIGGLVIVGVVTEIFQRLAQRDEARYEARSKAGCSKS